MSGATSEDDLGPELRQDVLALLDGCTALLPVTGAAWSPSITTDVEERACHLNLLAHALRHIGDKLSYLEDAVGVPVDQGEKAFLEAVHEWQAVAAGLVAIVRGDEAKYDWSPSSALVKCVRTHDAIKRGLAEGGRDLSGLTTLFREDEEEPREVLHARDRWRRRGALRVVENFEADAACALESGGDVRALLAASAADDARRTVPEWLRLEIGLDDVPEDFMDVYVDGMLAGLKAWHDRVAKREACHGGVRGLQSA